MLREANAGQDGCGAADPDVFPLSTDSRRRPVRAAIDYDVAEDWSEAAASMQVVRVLVLVS